MAAAGVITMKLHEHSPAQPLGTREDRSWWKVSLWWYFPEWAGNERVNFSWEKKIWNIGFCVCECTFPMSLPETSRIYNVNIFATKVIF